VHLHYFDRRTIARLLESSGFQVALVRPHIQQLELDYLLSRGAVLSQPASSLARRIVAPLGLGRRQVSYWLGQTFVAARRLQTLLLACGTGANALAEVLLLL
jgi:hypothetical protein